MTATVTPDGLIALPAGALEILGLKAGQSLEIHTEGGLVVAWESSQMNPFEKWRGRGRLPIGLTGDEYLRSIRDGGEYC